jgi:hypothetical protein
MKSITVHNLDETTSTLIEQKSKEWGLSLNKTIQQLLRQALGMPPGKISKREEFRDFFGSWTDDDLKDFESRTEHSRQVDPRDWE